MAVEKELLLEFFLTFSKFEFAMKESGFFRRSRYGNAEPNWNEMIEKVSHHFDKNDNQELKDACDLMLDNPPNIQTVRGDTILWDTQSQHRNETEIKFLFRMVKSVRNNLFHGGKHFRNNRALRENHARKTILLKSALIILNYTANLNAALQYNFYQSDI